MALRRLLTAGVFARSGAAVLLGGCLDELPEPAECPPPAQLAEGDCSAIDPPLTGCLPPAEHACLAGPRSSCACGPDECPDDARGCFPNGDCPPEVVAVAGEGVRCLRLDDAHVGDLGLLPPGHLCTCGCTRCLSVCDGKGPTVGATIVGDGVVDAEDVVFPLMRVDDLLPAAGRLGLYLRTRGTAATILYAYRGDPGANLEGLEQLGAGLLSAGAGAGFAGHVLWEELVDDLGAPVPLTWSRAEDKPSLMVILPNVTVSGPLLVELDCVIPFVTP